MKITSTWKKLSLLFLASVCSSVFTNAQIFYMQGNGLNVAIKPGGVVQINGGFENANQGNLVNDGEMTVDASATYAGDFHNNQAYVGGSGTFNIEDDWILNGQFDANSTNTSKVVLDGNNQQITGGIETTFYDLELEGTGVKSQTLDAYVLNTLALNDRELDVSDHKVHVYNTDAAAVTNDNTYGSEGFVSSIQSGALEWDVDQASDYIFPVGSSVNTTRYRPVTVKPNSSAANTFAVSFTNYEATTDGYDVTNFDTNICRVNELYYHKIYRLSGSTPADLTINFEPSDGDWVGLAQWNSLWNDLGSAVLTTGAFYNSVSISNHNDFTTEPYALDGYSPNSPEVSGLSDVCENDVANAIYTAYGGDNSTFIWSVNGGLFLTDSIGDQVQVDWDPDVILPSQWPKVLTVTEKNSLGCSSDPTSYTVNIFPLPEASFTADTFAYNYDLLSFSDSSIGNSDIADWAWDFGDGYTSEQQHPYHQYDEPGTYEVMLVVTNENGCLDTIFSDVIIEEGITIPNTFTPNSDGVNDYFLLPNSGIEEFSIQIFNRWGTLVFETNSPDFVWDGKTRAGLDVPAGTYFYIVNALSTDNGNDYSQQGTVSLLRD